MEKSDLMTTPEVARYLRVHTNTIYNYVKSGALPGIHVGRFWRFKKSDVDAWLNANVSFKFKKGI